MTLLQAILLGVIQGLTDDSFRSASPPHLCDRQGLEVMNLRDPGTIDASIARDSARHD